MGVAGVGAHARRVGCSSLAVYDSFALTLMWTSPMWRTAWPLPHPSPVSGGHQRAGDRGRPRRGLLEALEALAGGQSHPRLTCHHLSGQRGKIVFVFPGQGAQYPGMGAQLMSTTRYSPPPWMRCARL